MRDIYLIDFENVASDGLSGITYLAPEDKVVIFYSNNSKSLSMKMHILIGKSVCNLDYVEAAVGGKNALDHQLSTYLGYLVGTGAAERNYYIVSRDMGYKFVAGFWSEREPVRVRCVDSIKAAGRLERNRQQQREAQKRQEEAQTTPDAETSEGPVVAMEVPVEPAAEPVSAPAETSAAPVGEVQEERSEGETQNRSNGRNRRSRHSRGHRRSEGQTAEVKQETAELAESPVQEEKTEQKAPKQPARSGKKDESFDLSAMLAPYPMLQENHLRELIGEKKKQILCNTLRKQLGQEKGLALYNEIKRAAWR